MSAWIPGKVHIDLLVTAALAWELIVQEKADETGLMLWREAQASVSYRYPNDRDGEWPGPWFPDLDRGLTLADIDAYEFEALEGRIDPQVVSIANRSYRYQSCEHPGWKASEAYRLTTAIQEEADKMLPGYEQRWGQVEEDQVGLYLEGGAWSGGSRTLFQAAEHLRAATDPSGDPREYATEGG